MVPEYRALHTSDVHLGAYDRTSAERRERSNYALTRVIDVAAEVDADVLLIAGDLFDNHYVSEDTLMFSMAEISRLKKPVFVLPGNHDHAGPGSVYSRLRADTVPTNLNILREGEGPSVRAGTLDLDVWGRAHLGNRCSPLRSPQPRGRAHWQVAMAHGHYLPEGRSSSASYLITSADLEGCERDYVALGHWDNMTRVPTATGQVAAYSGSPTAHDGSLAEVLVVDFEATGRVRLSARHLETGAVREHHEIPNGVYQ